MGSILVNCIAVILIGYVVFLRVSKVQQGPVVTALTYILAGLAFAVLVFPFNGNELALLSLMLVIFIMIFFSPVCVPAKNQTVRPDLTESKSAQIDVARLLSGVTAEHPGSSWGVIYIGVSRLGEAERFRLALRHVLDACRSVPVRWVGDLGVGEFLLALPGDVNNLRQQIGLVAHAIHSANVGPDQFVARVPWIRIGACVEAGPAVNAPKVIQQATLAAGMAVGNELWHEFDPVLHQRNLRKEEILQELGGAVRRGEISVVYQPIVDSVSHQTVKLEALVRWRNRRFGDIRPDEFVPLAEQVGLMTDIGDFVLRCASLQLSHWRKLGMPTVQISVNVSQSQLESPGFAAHVVSRLAHNNVPSGLLELEVTERVLLDSNRLITKCLGDLRAAGVRIAIDDFGTGTSALSALSNFSFDTLKIDRSFLAAIDVSERGRKLYESICAMGKSMGMNLVAEGVETAAQAEWLRMQGVHYQQGWLHGRPQSAIGIQQRLIRAHRRSADHVLGAAEMHL